MTSPRPPVESIDNAFIRLGNLAAILHFSRIPSGRSRGRLHPDPLADLDWGAMKAGSPFPLIDGLRDDLKAAWKVVSLVHRPEAYVGTVRIGDRTGTRSWPTAVDRLLESGDEVVAIFDKLRREPPERTDGRTRIASQRVREVLSVLLTDGFRSELANEFRPLKCHVDDRRGAEELKRNKPRASRPSQAEIDIKVRDWLAKNAKDDPGAVTRDRIANETGVSTGAVSGSAPWKAFTQKRCEGAGMAGGERFGTTQSGTDSAPRPVDSPRCFRPCDHAARVGLAARSRS